MRGVWKPAMADVLQADWNRNNNVDHSMTVTKTYRGTPRSLLRLLLCVSPVWCVRSVL